MKLNKKLLKSIENTHADVYDQIRCKLIEEKISSKTNDLGIHPYASTGSEIAILRKQIAMILSVLKENGINAEHPEFAALNLAAEAAKETIKNLVK
jgi:hypothetical protein